MPLRRETTKKAGEPPHQMMLRRFFWSPKPACADEAEDDVLAARGVDLRRSRASRRGRAGRRSPGTRGRLDDASWSAARGWSDGAQRGEVALAEVLDGAGERHVVVALRIVDERRWAGRSARGLGRRLPSMLTDLVAELDRLARRARWRARRRSGPGAWGSGHRSRLPRATVVWRETRTTSPALSVGAIDADSIGSSVGTVQTSKTKT